MALVSVRLRKKLLVFFHILPFFFFRFQSIRIIRVYMELGSLQVSFGSSRSSSSSSIAEILRSRKWSGDRILDNLFPGHCYLFLYTQIFWTLELQQRVQILRGCIFFTRRTSLCMLKALIRKLNSTKMGKL